MPNVKTQVEVEQTKILMRGRELPQNLSNQEYAQVTMWVNIPGSDKLHFWVKQRRSNRAFLKDCGYGNYPI